MNQLAISNPRKTSKGNSYKIKTRFLLSNTHFTRHAQHASSGPTSLGRSSRLQQLLCGIQHARGMIPIHPLNDHNQVLIATSFNKHKLAKLKNADLFCFYLQRHSNINRFTVNQKFLQLERNYQPLESNMFSSNFPFLIEHI